MTKHTTILGAVYDSFAQKTPVAVMAMATMERCLNPTLIDQVFDQTAQTQYTRKLLFSTTFTLFCEVVCNVHRSVNAAYQAHADELTASVVALYDKLKHTEPAVLSGLVRRTAQELEPGVAQTGGALPSPLPGRRVRILDGNCAAATQRRLKVLRGVQDAPLPGKALVVLDPASRLIVEVLACEDGHAQERRLFEAVAALIQAGDLWIADRNMCTLGWVGTVASKLAFFVVRQHGNFPLEPMEAFHPVGRNASGEVSEQRVRVQLPDGQTREWRRVRVVLDKPTRDGETEIMLLTNLSVEEADAFQVAQLYLERWTIERVFQEIEATLHNEINTLAYPRAALFGLCIGFVAWNALAVIKAAMRAAHGAQTVETQLSGYYFVDELESTRRGLEIALPTRAWDAFRQMAAAEFAAWLVGLAKNMFLARYKKHPRGPKRPQPPRVRLGRGPGSHVSTALLLAAAKLAAKQAKCSP
jgi:hypothetical protein